jgi:hypothetical protein
MARLHAENRGSQISSESVLDFHRDKSERSSLRRQVADNPKGMLYHFSSFSS